MRYVPGLMWNLISVGPLDDEGHSMVFCNGEWKVTKGTMVVAQRKKTRTLSVNSNCRSTTTMTKNTVSLNLWHYRLGHMSEKGMKMLHSNGKLHGLKEVDHSFCESCAFGKQKRVNFSKVGRELRTKKLELIHIDI